MINKIIVEFIIITIDESHERPAAAAPVTHFICFFLNINVVYLKFVDGSGHRLTSGGRCGSCYYGREATLSEWFTGSRRLSATNRTECSV